MAKDTVDTASFLAGDGEAARAMRAANWDATPIGPPARWPGSLRTLARLVLDAHGAMFVVWGAEGTLLVNDACASLVSLAPAGATGRCLRDLHPDIAAALAPLVAGETAGTVAVGGLAFSCTPVRDTDSEAGGTLGLLCHCRESAGAVERVRDAMPASTLREPGDALTRLAEERAFLEAVIESIPIGVSIARDPLGEPPILNAEARRMMRLDRFEGDLRRYKGLGAITREGRRLAVEEYPTTRALRGEEVRDYEMTYELGAERRRWLVNSRPLRDGEGRVVAAMTAFLDVEDQRRVEEQRRLLADEMNHRVKNTLAIVQALAKQSFRDAGSAVARETFADRLQSLARTHNLLTDEDWRPTTLERVVRTALASRGADGATDVEGPEVVLAPRTAVSIAMALHELATNASKYGALSVPEGRVAIAWSIEGDGTAPRLLFVWRERGGPPVAAPAGRGFGSRMIERALAGELGGSAHLAFEPDGVVCTIRAPLPQPFRAA